MTTQPTGPGDDPDDLDRAFGPDTASVTRPPVARRVRSGSVIALAAAVTGVVLVLVLSTIIGSIQNGVGGIFPQPDAALDRLRTLATDVDGVASVQDGATEKRSFASWDVSAVVVADGGLSHGEQTDLVRALSAAVATADGNGVRVGVEARFDGLRIGVSNDAATSVRRLDLARTVGTIGGVVGVSCSWGPDGPSDEPADQRVVVLTVGRGVALAAIVDVATDRTHRVFPGATIGSARPS